MNNQTNTKDFLKSQCLAYPKLKPQDLLKGLHQSIFGCGHFVTDNARAFLYEELETISDCTGSDIEMLDGDFCRVYLSYLKNSSLSPETLFKLFVMSSEMSCTDIELLEKKLTSLLDLTKSGQLPFSYNEMMDAVSDWRSKGFPPCRHSSEFRQAYSPAYRVIHKDFIKWLPILSAIDKKNTSLDNMLFAIEGGSASGKTTLSDLLSRIYDCNIFHMDDFFLQPEQRTSERLKEPGGNIDSQRFLKEVLQPLSKGECVSYRKYDCTTQRILDPIMILPKKLNIVEGAYSMHPTLSDFYDYSVFLNISESLQKERIHIRNSKKMQERFFSIWIPMEKKYFKAFDIANRCDIILEVDK